MICSHDIRDKSMDTANALQSAVQRYLYGLGLKNMPKLMSYKQHITHCLK
jgi:hypothetical protein